MSELVFPEAQWWIALLQIIGIDIILSGDNALVLALACRRLPPKQRRLGIWFGTLAAIPLMVIGSRTMLWLIDRAPVLIVLGSGLLGWIAGELLLLDPLVAELLDEQAVGVRYVFAAGFALFVVSVGLLLRRRIRARGPVSP